MRVSFEGVNPILRVLEPWRQPESLRFRSRIQD
jgi:hypothetical protein